MNSSRLTGLATVLSLAAACTLPPSETKPSDGALTDASREDPIDLDVSGSGNVVIPRSSLGQRVYRLVSTVAYAKWNKDECGPTPSDYKPAPPGDIFDTCFHKVIPLATRRVKFAEKGERIVMTEGETELATFGVVTRSADGIEFSFSPDVLHVKTNIQTALPDLVAKVLAPKVRTRKANGWLSVQQDAELEIPGAATLPGRIKYGLAAEPEANPAFAPSFQPEGQPKYFYEVNSEAHPIAKYDFTKGQVVKIRNVGAPAAKRALADGALSAAVDYWNRVFQAASGETSRSFFEVETSTADEVFAHDPGYNVVQWMTYEGNAASNGVFQNDLLTGETLFGNAYISAAFFNAGADTAKALYKRTHETDAPQSAVDRFLADYMFETVAHEIGHTLGLQHDFEASNLASGRTPADLQQIAVSYFKDGETPPDLCSSIMEYLPLPIAGMLGGHMRKHVLPHDLTAIARGYYGKRADLASVFGPELAKRAEALPYCNDATMTAPSCKQFDHPLCAIDGDCFPAN